jgi:RND family efflux transporter MFP subunit
MWKCSVIFCLLLLAGCSGKKDAARAGDEAKIATPVQVATAKLETIHRTVTAEAVLYPIVQANIVPKISAPVRRFYAQRGDHVGAGQLLAVLENRDLDAATRESKQLYEQADAGFQNIKSATLPEDLIKAKSDVTAARQTLEAAKKIYASREGLVKEGALAQKVLDDAKVSLVQAQSAYDIAQQHLTSLQTVGQASQLRSSQAQLDAAEAHYQSAAAQSSYAEVRSPIQGLVADRPLNIGEMASSGSALFTVVDISRIVARANISVAQAAFIKNGQPATIMGPGGDLEGKVSVVSPAVDTNTTTVQVWVEAVNTGERLKPGTTVQISIAVGEVKDAVTVPLTALLTSDEGGDKVMIAGADSLAHEQKVEVGVRDGDTVQLLGGVKAGDKVVVSGGLGLDDKAKIAIEGGKQ